MSCLGYLTVTRLSAFYGAAWLGALWAPFIVVAAGYGPSYSIFRQFTWWCWLLQALFYTAVHPWARRYELLHAACVRRSGAALGAVCGNVATLYLIWPGPAERKKATSYSRQLLWCFPRPSSSRSQAAQIPAVRLEGR